MICSTNGYNIYKSLYSELFLNPELFLNSENYERAFSSIQKFSELRLFSVNEIWAIIPILKIMRTQKGIDKILEEIMSEEEKKDEKKRIAQVHLQKNIAKVWENFGKHPNIDFEQVFSTWDCPEFEWNNGIFARSTITLEEIKTLIESKEYRHAKYTNSGFKIHWRTLSEYANINFYSVRKTINDKRYNWNWDTLPFNRNIKYSDVLHTVSNKKYKWRIKNFSRNKSQSSLTIHECKSCFYCKSVTEKNNIRDLLPGPIRWKNRFDIIQNGSLGIPQDLSEMILKWL